MPKISDAEMEIMKIIWNNNNPLTSKQIIELIPNNQWKTTTVLTLLSRLVDKGFLKAERKGRNHLYSYILSYKEYSKLCSKKLINKFYQGSFKNFFAALYADNEISQEDLYELREMLNKREDK
ncbi:BlaI/MecI/CopY family transcriptional regulator [Clostridium sp. MD294]|uniref:BlaI/MecI/CopY family transcriptional regulator n=1 Tax=Clostridium sp. MD294 TaxID=97138 RepID=UPI0002C991DE|nr:BlaI/MecI/CopY family transcriptional regulator [Clostridium sp. MD294]NDO47822.1 BlaI/MecI/CopY family transcriptional regulator [Clostridium sp. MD294]USF29858.1 Penicillinase repressor [Clostridium sp. MD294]